MRSWPTRTTTSSLVRAGVHGLPVLRYHEQVGHGLSGEARWLVIGVVRVRAGLHACDDVGGRTGRSERVVVWGAKRAGGHGCQFGRWGDRGTWTRLVYGYMKGCWRLGKQVEGWGKGMASAQEPVGLGTARALLVTMWANGAVALAPSRRHIWHVSQLT